VQIEPWQVPVLVMTVVILPPSAVWAVRRLQGGTVDARPPTRRPATTPATEQAEEGRFRTSVLAVLTAVLLGLFFLAIGTEQANLLTSAATAVSTSVSAALTVRSFLDVKDLKEDVRKLGAQGETDRAGRGVEPGKKPERQ
jgi:hypothetical protein